MHLLFISAQDVQNKSKLKLLKLNPMFLDVAYLLPLKKCMFPAKHFTAAQHIKTAHIPHVLKGYFGLEIFGNRTLIVYL